MGLYNFHPQFVPPILAGTKTHTIRAERTHPDKSGNTLHLYVGLRTRSVSLIGRATCSKVEPITIRGIGHGGAVDISGCQLDDYECNCLAVRDGFRDFDDMLKFWEGRLPFQGHIIHWKDFVHG